MKNQKILIIETEKRELNSKGKTWQNINFFKEESCQFPDTPKEALKHGWWLINEPSYTKNEEGFYEWWFEQVQ